MELVNELYRKSGLTLHELGRRMGYPETSAKQSAYQFLRTSDPHLSTVQKFAKAMDMPILVLIQKMMRSAIHSRLVTK